MSVATALVDAASPVRIQLSKDRACLTLEWPDGALQRIEAGRLRAHSRSSGAIRARVDGLETHTDEGITIRGVELVGSYAVNLSFSDGHDRGIYPWSYLRELGVSAD